MKRFWQDVAIAEREGGHAVELDRRPLRTPLRGTLVVPTAELAGLIAGEWRSVGDDVDPKTMIGTRLANTVVDRMPRLRQAAIDELLSYCRTDLICYRATRPAELVRRQEAVWDPVLAWLAQRHDAPLSVTADVAPVEQPEASLAHLRRAIERADDWGLVGLHALAQTLASAALALAVADRHLAPPAAFDASTVDERFEMEQWGWDSEVDRKHRMLAREVERAAAFLDALAPAS